MFGGRRGALARDAVDAHDVLAAPAILPAEVAQVMRSLSRRGQLAGLRAYAALERVGDLPLSLAEFLPHRRRVWELRDNVSAYDAWYVALAESLDVPLVTLDARLARAAGPRCQIVLLGEE
ncbi:MAG: type II toxin-antitoxin system VapC family toxin [Actinomycetota bacterium]|nr:type II toxin-antitoxin system VapC family toxin [Actinomycetota bacterium]